MKYPDFPEEWDNPELTLFRNFYLDDVTFDSEILIDLVKDNMSDRGNEGVTKARLLGILRSEFDRANLKFWIRHSHKYTWRFRYRYRQLKRYLGWRLKLPEYKRQLRMIKLTKDLL